MLSARTTGKIIGLIIEGSYECLQYIKALEGKFGVKAHFVPKVEVLRIMESLNSEMFNNAVWMVRRNSSKDLNQASEWLREKFEAVYTASGSFTFTDVLMKEDQHFVEILKQMLSNHDAAIAARKHTEGERCGPHVDADWRT